MITLLPGIVARRVPTERLTANVLEVDGRTGTPVLFVHGNVSSSLFWQRTMLDLPEGYRPLAVDLRGFGDTDPLPVDATRGLRDHAEDVVALVRALDLGSPHLVGWSMGGGVVLRILRADPTAVRTATLVNPVSPYGFGGTRGVDGEPLGPAGLGAGGGAANPDFVRLLAAGDRSDDSPLSPRQVLLSYYVKPPLRPADLEVLVESMLSTRTGEDHYPGDLVAARDWPGVAAGGRGVLNSMAPNHFRIDDLHTISPKPPICWIRGADDQIVSDASVFDLAFLGSVGALPDWPGAGTHPPQPMVAQTRAVLERYARAGGTFDEVVFPDTGHSPHLERPAEFVAALREILAKG
ncbi:alpha/beta fold hydrolase [Actinophytocola xanthii]|uniref:Alpha/beta hydrolase n=1 Tax=Actinophytocola xanthii TaxID=1912961 RepID=A0A1Q8CME4_9PSEU|nr:alpha/beta hydrolase [Actinophytocola xanthii]OLF15519.1 alpha/beta hydrolase [Actinophytocola xanthii]